MKKIGVKGIFSRLRKSKDNELNADSFFEDEKNLSDAVSSLSELDPELDRKVNNIISKINQNNSHDLRENTQNTQNTLNDPNTQNTINTQNKEIVNHDNSEMDAEKIISRVIKAQEIYSKVCQNEEIETPQSADTKQENAEPNLDEIIARLKEIESIEADSKTISPNPVSIEEEKNTEIQAENVLQYVCEEIPQSEVPIIKSAEIVEEIKEERVDAEEKPETKPKAQTQKFTPHKTKWSTPDTEKEADEDLGVDASIVSTNENEKSKTAAKHPKTIKAKKTIWSESDDEDEEEIKKEAKVVSVDDLESAISDLILPDSAKFEIEEFKIQTDKHSGIGINHNETVDKINKIYSACFPPIDLQKLNEVDLSEKTEKKKGLKSLFAKSSDKKNEFVYDPSIHPPLVDLTFNEPEGVEETDLYPVNEPYAYIRIIFDKNTNEYTYIVLEPVLTPAEEVFLSEIEQRLFETLNVNTKDLTKEKAKEILRGEMNNTIRDYNLKMEIDEREKIYYHIIREFLGDGLIDAIMHDKYIEDVSCDGLNTPIFVFHSKYESIRTSVTYKTADKLDSFVTKLAQKAGKYISIAEPMLDATMTDGSRIQMTLGSEVTAHGSTFTIRKFKDEPITPTDLIEWGTFSPLSIAYIWMAVESGKSCIFAGGTASGKTTSLNAISLFIPPLAKIVTLEDTRELKLPHQNWIPSVTRESFDKNGKGSIDMYELLRAALRQRPEYIIVGEVRGAEAQTLFQAMSTGHVTYATMHADSIASAVHRIENPPLDVPRNMLSSLNLMSVQVQAKVGGQRIRRNKQIIEILDIDPRTNELITNEVFKWHQSADEIRYSGKSYILEDIMETRGWDEKRTLEELKRRQEILEWMRVKKLRNYKDVGKVLMSYYRDPESVIKLVRGDLYE